MANLKYRGNTTTPTKPTSTTAKNAPLTNEEIDGNLRSLNDSKLEMSGWTPGDTFYADATGNLVRLPIGTTNQTLSVVGGLPAWTTGAASTTDIQEFTTVGTSTWIKPSGAKLIHVLLIAGGGGGGSGGVIRSDGLTTITMTGGGGGGAGGRMEYWISASELGATESVVVGAAGIGAAGNTFTPDSNYTGFVENSSSGTAGTFSRFGLRYAIGGRAGQTALQALNISNIQAYISASTGIAQVYAAYRSEFGSMRVFAGGYGGIVYAQGSATPNGIWYAGPGGDGSNSPGGGGSGAGLARNTTSSSSGGNGGKAGYAITSETTVSDPAGHGYESSFFGNGQGYTTETPLSRTVGGWGGGGGANGGASNAGNGGLGGWPGGGGGGGGSARQGFSSGSGGNGGSGYVKITTFK